LDKIQAGKGKNIDGHAPGLRGKNLNAYVLAGVRSDHESTELAEAQEKIRLGMHILLREGSTERNLETLVPLHVSAGQEPCARERTRRLLDDEDPPCVIDARHDRAHARPFGHAG